MKTFFQELFQYNHHVNQQLIAVLIQNQGKVSERCLQLLSHILNAHQVWNVRLLPGQPPYTPWQIHPLQECGVIDQQNFEDSMRVLDQFELDQPFRYLTTKGQPFTNNVRDILFQVINHSTYHRGQIATAFRESGIEPLLTDYIFYKWHNPPNI